MKSSYYRALLLVDTVLGGLGVGVNLCMGTPISFIYYASLVLGLAALAKEAISPFPKNIQILKITIS